MENNQLAIMACMRKSDLTEAGLNQWDTPNVEDVCANPACKEAIVHRPIENAENLVKCCLPCALSLAAGATGEVQVGVHPDMEDEARGKLGEKYDSAVEEAKHLFAKCVEARKALEKTLDDLEH